MNALRTAITTLRELVGKYAPMLSKLRLSLVVEAVGRGIHGFLFIPDDEVHTPKPDYSNLSLPQQLIKRAVDSFDLKMVFLLMLLFLAFSFRHVFADLPYLIAEKKFIAFDELIPIFDLQTQFFDQISQGFSPLTSTNEIRIRYSALTTWTRYAPIIFFSLLLMNALSYTLMVYATKRFLSISSYLRETITERKRLFVAMVVNFPLFILLLYAKVTHYYTLIFGLALLYLAFELTLEMFLTKTSLKKKAFLVFLLVLFNPAVHYHLLYYGVTAFVWIFFLGAAVMRKLPFKRFVGVTALYTIICAVSIGAYAFFLFGAGSVYSTSNLNNVAPVNFFLLENSSTSIDHVIGLDLYSPVDNFYYQSYLPPETNMLNGVFIVMALLPLIFILGSRFINRWDKIDKLNHLYLPVMYLSLFSVYMALGLTFDGTIHSLLIDNIDSPFFQSTIGALVLKAFQTFVSVIRFPHRFQLVYLMTLAFNASLGLLLLQNAVRNSIITIELRRPLSLIGAIFTKRTFYYMVLILLICIPFLNNVLYTTVLASGNWNGIFQPFAVDGEEILKEIIQEDEDVFVAPYLEHNNFIINEKGYRHKFIDKFWIYLLNEEGSYYGLGGDALNKLNSFLFLRAALYEDEWWVKILRDQGFEYLLFIKDTESELFDIDRSIDKAVEANSTIKQVSDFDRFRLYRIDPTIAQDEIIVSLNWQNYIKLMNENSRLNQNTFTYQFNVNAQQLDDRLIMTDDPQWIRQYVEVIEHPERTTYIPLEQLTFRKNVFPSSQYQASVISMLNLLSENPQFNKIGIPFPSVMLKTTNLYSGISGQLDVTIPLKVDSACSLYLNSINTDNDLEFVINQNGEPVSRVQLELDRSHPEYNDVSFTKLDLPDLEPGEYEITMEKKDENAMVFNYLLCSDKEYQADLQLQLDEKITLSNDQILEIYSKQNQ